MVEQIPIVMRAIKVRTMSGEVVMKLDEEVQVPFFAENQVVYIEFRLIFMRSS